MFHPRHAVIAAAGLGSRLGQGIPKCLVEIGGRTLVERMLGLLRDVEDVRIVVGYREAAVIEVVSRIDREVTLVRNPDYRTTTTQDSYAIGAAGLSDRCLFMDADIVFEPRSFFDFLSLSAREELTIGITAAKTDQAVFAETRPTASGRGLEVTSFSDRATPYEWANIVCAPPASFARGRGAVFETLQGRLPAPAGLLVSYEVDTEGDLERARAFVGGGAVD